MAQYIPLIDHLRNRYFLAADVIVLLLAPLVAFAVRFESVEWIVLRARNGVLAESRIREVDALVRGAEVGESEENIRHLLRALVPDFHPHGPLPKRHASSSDLVRSAAIA